MPAELDRLATDLTKMHAQFPVLGKVDFRPTEPNLALTFELTKTGQALGHFRLCPNLAEDTLFQGSFHIDQSYLPVIAHSIRSFLQTSDLYIRLPGPSPK